MSGRRIYQWKSLGSSKDYVCEHMDCPRTAQWIIRYGQKMWPWNCLCQYHYELRVLKVHSYGPDPFEEL